MIIWL